MLEYHRPSLFVKQIIRSPICANWLLSFRLVVVGSQSMVGVLPTAAGSSQVVGIVWSGYTTGV